MNSSGKMQTYQLPKVMNELPGNRNWRQPDNLADALHSVSNAFF
jgi:hypothetical protein